MGRPHLTALVLLLTTLGCQGRTSPSAEPLSPAEPSKVEAEPSPAHGWLRHLQAPTQRAQAAKHLTELLDGWNSAAGVPPSAELRGQVIDALTKVYVERRRELDTASRVDLIRVLAESKDERAVPAFVAALEEFANNQPTRPEEADLLWAVRAYRALPSEQLAPGLMNAFEKFHAHTLLGGHVYRELGEALRVAPRPEWAPALLRMLEAEMLDPRDASTREEARSMVDGFRDQTFWQITVIELLGELERQDAVEALFKVLLTPSKAAAGRTAVVALGRIGKPSLVRAIAILDGTDPLLAHHAAELRKRAGVKPYVERPEPLPPFQAAASVIGYLGLPEGAAPLMAAVQRATTPADKAAAAAELCKLSGAPGAQAVFRKAFEEVPATARVGTKSALTRMAESAAPFYDSSLVPWLLERATRTRGTPEELAPVREALLVAAAKLSGPQQWPRVEGAARQLQLEEVVSGYAAPLHGCGEDTSCYLEILPKVARSEDDRPAAFKTLYMLGTLGDSRIRDAIIALLDDIEDPAARFVAAQTIDHLTPDGALHVRTAIQDVVARNMQLGDRKKQDGDRPLRELAARLAIRSGR